MFDFIILNYNQHSILKRAINSVRYACKNIKYHIYIVDNNSDIFELIKIYGYDSDITIVSNFLLRNKSKSRNLGLKIVKSDYIYFIDGDDYLIPHILNDVLKDIVNNYSVIITSRIQIKDKNRVVEPLKKFATHGLVINKNFCIKNNIFFDEIKYVFMYEDVFFTSLLFNHALYKEYKILNTPSYIHELDLKRCNVDMEYLICLYNTLIRYIKNQFVKKWLNNKLINDIINYEKRN